MADPLRCSLNVTFHFPGAPLEEALDGAVAAGFHTIELLDADAFDIDDLERALRRRGLRVDVFNLALGDFAAGERGYAADPDRRGEFRDAVERALVISERVGATKVNALAGRRIEPIAESMQLELAAEQFGWAAERLEVVGVRVNTELLNPIETPGLLLQDLDTTLGLIESTGGRIGLQLDVYHLQRTQGELVRTIERTAPVTGHIQVADAPDRTEPGSGEINYATILEAIAATGYDGLVGCEFRPSGQSDDPFQWIEAHGLLRA